MNQELLSGIWKKLTGPGYEYLEFLPEKGNLASEAYGYDTDDFESRIVSTNQHLLATIAASYEPRVSRRI